MKKGALAWETIVVILIVLVVVIAVFLITQRIDKLKEMFLGLIDNFIK